MSDHDSDLHVHDTAHDSDQPDEHHDHEHQHGRTHAGDDHQHAAGHHHHGDGGHHHHGDAPRNAPLERGAGTGKVLFFDAFSGVAGDMTIAALLDLGVPQAVVEQAVSVLPLDGYELVRGHAHRSGVVATRFDVKVAAAQPERTYGAIDSMLVDAPLDAATKKLARAIFLRLGEAEAATHCMPLNDVHFHEVGAVDAIVDIVGAAAALSYVNAEVAISPLPMGRGFVKARHGILPLPAPATVSCLRGVPTFGTDVDFEFVTPTGAAIVATVATEFARWPSMLPERVGFGGGSKDLKDRPNLLRVVLGSRPTSDDGQHIVVEANIDDMTGEVAAHAIKMLLADGALDAWAVPITMKKGRPAITLCALCTRANEHAVASAMLRETTSLGVRITVASRVVRPRREVTVKTRFGDLPLKVSGGPFGPEQVKPELDAAAAAAQTHGVPLREVLSEALAVYRASKSS